MIGDSGPTSRVSGMVRAAQHPGRRDRLPGVPRAVFGGVEDQAQGRARQACTAHLPRNQQILARGSPQLAQRALDGRVRAGRGPRPATERENRARLLRARRSSGRRIAFRPARRSAGDRAPRPGGPRETRPTPHRRAAPTRARPARTPPGPRHPRGLAAGSARPASAAARSRRRGRGARLPVACSSGLLLATVGPPAPAALFVVLRSADHSGPAPFVASEPRPGAVIR